MSVPATLRRRLTAILLGGLLIGQPATAVPFVSGGVVVRAGGDLVYVEPATGNRSVISAQTDTGLQLVQPLSGGYTVAADGDVLAIAHPIGSPQEPVVVRIDPGDGSWSVLSGSGVGTGPPLVGLADLAVDTAGVVYAAAERAVVRIDPATGNRSVVTSHFGPFGTLGSGPSLNITRQLAVDPSGDLVIQAQSGNIFDGIFESVLAVDVTTGDRTRLFDTRDLPGAGSIGSLGVASDGSVLTRSGALLGSVVVWDPLTQMVSELSSASTGGGPAPGIVSGVDAGAGVIIATDRVGSERRVLRIDPLSGDRTVVSSNAVGFGPLFASISSPAVVPSGVSRVAIPEPSLALLLGSGLLLLGRAGRPSGSTRHTARTIDAGLH